MDRSAPGRSRQRRGAPELGHEDHDGEARGSHAAAKARAPIHEAADDGGQRCTDPEKDCTGAEGDIVCHDFNPRCGWTVTELRTTSSSAPARAGVPWRPSQTQLWPANRSASLARNGMMVRVSPHWLAKTTGIPRSCATRAGIEPERGPTWP